MARQNLSDAFFAEQAGSAPKPVEKESASQQFFQEQGVSAAEQSLSKELAKKEAVESPLDIAATGRAREVGESVTLTDEQIGQMAAKVPQQLADEEFPGIDIGGMRVPTPGALATEAGGEAVGEVFTGALKAAEAPFMGAPVFKTVGSGLLATMQTFNGMLEQGELPKNMKPEDLAALEKLNPKHSLVEKFKDNFRKNMDALEATERQFELDNPNAALALDVLPNLLGAAPLNVLARGVRKGTAKAIIKTGGMATTRKILKASRGNAIGRLGTNFGENIVVAGATQPIINFTRQMTGLDEQISTKEAMQFAGGGSIALGLPIEGVLAGVPLLGRITSNFKRKALFPVKRAWAKMMADVPDDIFDDVMAGKDLFKDLPEIFPELSGDMREALAASRKEFGRKKNAIIKKATEIYGDRLEGAQQAMVSDMADSISTLAQMVDQGIIPPQSAKALLNLRTTNILNNLDELGMKAPVAKKAMKNLSDDFGKHIDERVKQARKNPVNSNISNKTFEMINKFKEQRSLANDLYEQILRSPEMPAKINIKQKGIPISAARAAGQEFIPRSKAVKSVAASIAKDEAPAKIAQMDLEDITREILVKHKSRSETDKSVTKAILDSWENINASIDPEGNVPTSVLVEEMSVLKDHINRSKDASEQGVNFAVNLYRTAMGDLIDKSVLAGADSEFGTKYVRAASTKNAMESIYNWKKSLFRSETPEAVREHLSLAAQSDESHTFMGDFLRKLARYTKESDQVATQFDEAAREARFALIDPDPVLELSEKNLVGRDGEQLMLKGMQEEAQVEAARRLNEDPMEATARLAAGKDFINNKYPQQKLNDAERSLLQFKKQMPETKAASLLEGSAQIADLVDSGAIRIETIQEFSEALGPIFGDKTLFNMMEILDQTKSLLKDPKSDLKLLSSMIATAGISGIVRAIGLGLTGDNVTMGDIVAAMAGGGTIGLAATAAAKKYGPPAARKWMFEHMRSNIQPSYKKISMYDLPDEVINGLKSDFDQLLDNMGIANKRTLKQIQASKDRAEAARRLTRSMNVAIKEDNRSRVQQWVMDSTIMTNIQKAKSITSMNNRGVLPDAQLLFVEGIDAIEATPTQEIERKSAPTIQDLIEQKKKRKRPPIKLNPAESVETKSEGRF